MKTQSRSFERARDEIEVIRAAMKQGDNELAVAIDRLSADQRPHCLLVSRLDLSGAAREVTLLKALRQHLAETEVPEGWRHAVMLVELERLLDYRRIGAEPGALAVLQDANLQRDAFPRVCPVPVVVWLSPIATSVFAQAAPDLWHWRVATFDFTWTR